jgi:hypothetical protein
MAAAVLFQPILMGAPREANLKGPREEDLKISPGDLTKKPG